MPRPKFPVHQLLLRSVQVARDEVTALLWSFSYFFALLCSYYIIRPMRDEMGVLGGVENLQWLFTGTLLAMTAAIPLFGWVSSRFPRRRFLPYVYGFFILALLLFYLLMDQQRASPTVARAFFIWASVFNLFVVSVFWSFMTDIWADHQARRLFGFIAAGGTLGALAGPALTTLLVQPLGARNLLLVSALLLVWAIFCIARLSRWSGNRPTDHPVPDADQLLGGGIWDGIRLVIRSPYLLGICLLMLLFTTLATFLYLMQAQIVRDAFSDSAQRTAVFAAIDLTVNGLTLLLQLFLTSRLIKWFGLATVLAIIPLLLSIGFTVLSMAPVLMVLLVVQVIRRAGNYAIMRPAREMLYVVLTREEKYKAKNLIDTLIYRSGDAVSAWIYAGMRSLGMGLGGIALIAVPLALIWAGIAFSLGRQQVKLAETRHSEEV
ncbi:NTP/NDP exchange transporter [Sedimenticola thiotaurini]|uniref:NTP/NDP exchange transporter n=1 Tax=Sedimenticola thiotaurini TaxID=1543721 RepID=UPI0006994107|nr:MFS transporter [Sedimenticola thiotaurini]